MVPINQHEDGPGILVSQKCKVAISLAFLPDSATRCVARLSFHPMSTEAEQLVHELEQDKYVVLPAYM